METNNNYYYFVPIAVEIMGPWGDDAKKKNNEIGEKIHKITNELRATSYLIQRITIAVQRGNAASILETTQDSNNEKLEEIFYIL
jgi:ADP-dependent phosphofructokinase/glucokinase